MCPLFIDYIYRQITVRVSLDASSHVKQVKVFSFLFRPFTSIEKSGRRDATHVVEKVGVRVLERVVLPLGNDDEEVVRDRSVFFRRLRQSKEDVSVRRDAERIRLDHRLRSWNINEFHITAYYQIIRCSREPDGKSATNWRMATVDNNNTYVKLVGVYKLFVLFVLLEHYLLHFHSQFSAFDDLKSWLIELITHQRKNYCNTLIYLYKYIFISSSTAIFQHWTIWNHDWKSWSIIRERILATFNFIYTDFNRPQFGR